MKIMPTVPPFLLPGDTVGVVAPASRVRYEDCLPGIQILREKWHLDVREGVTLRSEHYQYSATDAVRTGDLQRLLDDSKVKAIIAARGGYGCSRIVDSLDFTKFKKHPKWLVGFSDLTVLLSQANALGIAALHAPMVKSMTQEGGGKGMESLRRALFGESIAYKIPAHPFNRTGAGTGLVTGGNLCLLGHLLSSPSAVDTAGKILFIEDVNEYLYNIDRLMIQLKRAGQLDQLAGLVVGQFTDSRDNPDPPFGQTANEIVAEHTKDYDYPICFDFPVGHVPDNRALPVGMMAKLEVGEFVMMSYER